MRKTRADGRQTVLSLTADGRARLIDAAMAIPTHPSQQVIESTLSEADRELLLRACEMRGAHLDEALGDTRSARERGRTIVRLARLSALQSAINAGTRRQGFQMALGVAVAFMAAAATGLPERFWAVMTALIVMRSAAESTLAAGLDRAVSTALGRHLRHPGRLDSSPAGRRHRYRAGDRRAAMRAAWRPRCAGSPDRRADCPVLGKRRREHAAVGVAVLRLAQVIVGVAAAMAVAVLLAKWRSEDRLRLGCARLLRGAARHLEDTGKGAPSSAPRSLSAAKATQSALSRLAALADDTDRMASLLRREDSRDRWRQLVASTGGVIPRRFGPGAAGRRAGAPRWRRLVAPIGAAGRRSVARRGRRGRKR